MKGRIVDLFWDAQTCVYVTQGVKQKDQYKYASCPGGFGSYVTGGEYDSYVYVRVYVYDLERCVEFEIKDSLLNLNHRARISNQLVAQVKQKNVGKKISLMKCDTQLGIDLTQLDLIV